MVLEADLPWVVMCIGSAGEGVPGAGKTKADARKLSTGSDIDKAEQFFCRVYGDKGPKMLWGTYNVSGHSASARDCLNKIERFFKDCKESGNYCPVIYYTGHGFRQDGDWAFFSRPGEKNYISMEEIFELRTKYMPGSHMVILTDCCFSGHWVNRWAEYRRKNSGYAANIQILASASATDKCEDKVFADAVFRGCSDAQKKMETFKPMASKFEYTDTIVRWKGQWEGVPSRPKPI